MLDMAAGRTLQPYGHLPLWHCTPTHVAHLLPDSTLHLFSLPSASRQPSPPSLPPLSARPSALALQPYSSPPRVVVGTEAGDLLLNARRVASLPGPVGAVCFGDDVCLAAGGVHRELVVLSLKGLVVARHSLVGHIAPVSALAVGAGGKYALVCSQSVTLVDVASGDVLRTYTGQGGVITAAAMLPSGRFVTGGIDEFLYLWEGAEEGRRKVGKPKRRKEMASAPVCALHAPEGGVVSLAVGEEEQEEGRSLVVAAVLRGGSVAVWRGLEGRTGGDFSFVVRGGGEAVFGAVVKEGLLTVLYGNSLKPTVWSVRVAEVEGTEIILPKAEKDLLLRKERNDHVKKGERLVKDAVALEASAVAAMPVKEKRRGNGYVVYPGENDEKGDVEDEDESEEESVEGEDDREPSIQQKLLTMGVTLEGSDDVRSIRHVEGDRAVDKTVLGSRVRVLLQAVHSQDTDMFNRTIESLKTRKPIRSTVERVPPTVACGRLLDMLVERLRRNPAKAELLGMWIREVLLEHTGALVTQQSNKALTALIAIVTERTQALEGLSRLEGRLELVVGQAERVKRSGRLSAFADAAPQAEYVEEEGSEEDEDDEDEEEEDDSDREGSAVGDDASSEGEGGNEMEEAEDETGDFSESSEDSSEEEESDADMEDAAGKDAVQGLKRGADNEKMVVMNGRKEEGGESSESEKSSDDGD